MRYGGNTSCVEVRLDDDTLIIFALTTNQRGGKKAVGGLCALIAHTNTHSQPFRQQNLSRDAVRVPGIPARGQAVLKLGVLGRPRLGKSRCAANVE